MFDIGFTELVTIGLIALIVLGPKRLPEVARTAGRWAGQLRRFITDVKQDLDREMHSEELADLRKLKQELDSTRRLMENASGDLVQGFAEIETDISGPTIHAPETPELTHDVAPEPPAAPSGGRRRAKPRTKSASGRKHGATRKARRR